jgi:hypothetical protein
MNLSANHTYARLCARHLEKALLKNDYVKALGPYCTVRDLYDVLSWLPGPRPNFDSHNDLSRFNALIIQRVAYLVLKSSEQTGDRSVPRPPFNAEYILYLLLREQEREIVIGDLVEHYARVLTRFNKRRADIWYYKQVAGSLWPLLRRAIVKIGALVWLGKVLRRLIS